ncbi:glycosyltransferase [uncultured Aquitalea sp.]|uniref:glycosyltransferase n=1 Tax=uncultured Aquitalea sp. TaxID=540272 RepID=UPI0025E2A466|nr:glycosyltransferase [uncultured Aquitalea sp.]
MRIALLAPLPPEQSGIADYAAAFRQAMSELGVALTPPLAGGLPQEPARLAKALASVDWTAFDGAHAELGGGRCGEFLALEWLARHRPGLALTATVHDPERLIWRPPSLPAWWRKLPPTLAKLGVLALDPFTLRRERTLAEQLSLLVTLTETGRFRLCRRMGLAKSQVVAIAHGNRALPPAPLPPLPPRGPLRLLYFGFVYRGKGIEDLIDALALLEQQRPGFAAGCALTLAGGTQPDMTFAGGGDYLDFLRRRLREAGLARLTLDWRLDVEADAIPTLIQSCHVMVLPYRESARLAWLGQQRGTSGALSWAAACGRGAIASNARAFAEEVSHGNGVVYAQGDVPALADAIARMADQPARIAACAEAASRLGQARVWPSTAERFKKVFLRAQGQGETL